MLEEERWIEAEEWLNHEYPEYNWEAWNYDKITEYKVIIINRHSHEHKEQRYSTQIAQASFRKLVADTDFEHAMNHVLIMGHLMSFRDIYHRLE